VLETILRVFDRVEEVAADAARKEKANAKRLAQESADEKKPQGKRHQGSGAAGDGGSG